MSLLSTYRISKLGMQSFWRNRLLSLAAILVMTITLIIISFFAVMNSVISVTTQQLNDKIDLVIFFKDDAPESQILEFKQILASRAETKSIIYIDKQAAEAQYREKYKNDLVRLNSLEITGNVLPRSLQIKANPPEALESMVNYVTNSDYASLIRENGISYFENKNLIDKLLNLTKFIKVTGISISIFFIVVAVLVVFNTIKLTIFTRRDEIEIMRLVGATESFVRWPFVFEGILYGILATILSTALLYTMLQQVLKSEDKLGLLAASLVTPFAQFLTENLLTVLGLELLISIIIGAFCALLAIGKDAKV